jgi:PAS domain S-box-containing protein
MGQLRNILQWLRGNSNDQYRASSGRLGLRSFSARYLAAIVLAVVAQVLRIPLPGQTIAPFIITYAPFIVISAMLGGLGPGLLTTMLCVLEGVFFSIEPFDSFVVSDLSSWIAISTLVVTGVTTSVLAERLKRSGVQLGETHRKTSAILESISDGFNAFDREWRYIYVNAAAAKMVGKAPEEMLGRNLWETWPHVADSPFGDAYRRAVAENVPVQVEAFYPDLFNAWFEVRCYPSPEGLTVFFTDTTERRRVEEELRMMESAILQTSDGVLILKVAGEDSCRPTPVFANSALERMTGFSLEDLQTGSLPLLFGPGLDLHSIEHPRTGCPGGRPQPLELPVRRKDGSEFSAEFNFRPLTDASGNYTHCVWTCRDVTVRKQADEAARLLSSIVECSDDAIISKNLDGIVLSWNQGAERIYGYSSGEMVGRSISLLIPADRGDELPEILEYLKLGQQIEHLETERVKKDGQRIFVSLTISPLRDLAGSLVGASTITRDITERKRTEKALQLSEKRYRSLALVADQIVWATNPRGEVEEDVPTWRSFTGQSVDEIKGSGWIDAVHPEDRERAIDVWSRSLRNRSFHDIEYRLRRRDGEYRYMAVHGVPVLEEDGTVREWVGTCADITERKQIEEEIHRLNEDLERRVIERTAQWEASNKELEAFAYSVSHDLRAPLRAVDGFSRILLEEYALELAGEAQRYLNIVRKNAVQMGELIDRLLTFSRLGRQSLKKESIDLKALVGQTLEDMAREQEGRRIDIVIGELPPCEADRALLKQVIVNLLSNALKYTRCRDQARIEVGAPVSQQDGTVYFIRDNGAGFDMRYVDKLFGVFQRLHSAEEYEGTGVGLAIVHRIITRHGGRVWAEGEVDKGATFYFSLPAEERLGLPDHDSAQSLPEIA